MTTRTEKSRDPGETLVKAAKLNGEVRSEQLSAWRHRNRCR
jgi:hypothetical protein